MASLEGEQRQELLANLHQGLKAAEADVIAMDSEITRGPDNVLTVGELSEFRIDPKKAGLNRGATYFYYNFRSSYVPEQSEVESEIAESIARHRTRRVNEALAPAPESVEEAEVLPF